MMKQIPLHIHYDFLPSLARNDRDFDKKIRQMKAAEVSTLWLDCFLEGAWDSDPEEIYRLRQRLLGEGFEVQALNVPLGHGGQALDPSQPMKQSIRAGWPCRVDAAGRPWPNTTCVNQQVIDDSRQVAQTVKELGFTRLFYDDDLRMGVWGPQVQGCFCDDCLRRFYRQYPAYDGMSREDIVQGFGSDPALLDAWETVQCHSVMRFLEETTPEGLTPCFMIMHNGDRRHGLDVARMSQRFPDALIRVGEGHFGDDSFLHPLGRPAIERSIMTHLRLIGSVERACSESTTYPVGALSPENWIEKMRLEIKCGLRNIFLMSGTVFLTEPYWEALRKALPELKELALTTPLPELESLPSEEDFIWHL